MEKSSHSTFRKRHSKFRRRLDLVSRIMDKLLIIYWVTAGLIIAIPVLIAFYTLPTEVREQVTPLIGGAISLVVIPMMINHINRKKDLLFKIYEENKGLYIDLSKILIGLLTTSGEPFFSYRSQLYDFLCQKYSTLCLNCSYAFIWDIKDVYNESEIEDNHENIRYYSLKCLRQMYAQTGLRKTFYINNQVLDMIKNHSSFSVGNTKTATIKP